MREIALWPDCLSGCFRSRVLWTCCFERRPPSWRSCMMVSMSISIDTNNVWIPLVGLETWQGNFISYEASGKASSAGYTCAYTANSDRHLKDMADMFNIKHTAWKADREACQKRDECTVAYGALSKACDAGYTHTETGIRKPERRTSHP